jgi:cytochrome c oxidase cbb3-type subunit 2
MPPYAFLANAEGDTARLPEHVPVNRMLGVPYTEEKLANASADARAQANPLDAAAFDFEQRYPGAAIRDFDGSPNRVTEMDALVAYLQMLGAGVDFSTYQAEAPENQR